MQVGASSGSTAGISRSKILEALEDPAQCELEETSGWSLEPPSSVPLPRLSIKQAEQQQSGSGDVFKKAKAGMTVGASQDNISILD